MANFYKVHERALRCAGYHARERGCERWRVALREPVCNLDEVPPDFCYFVTFRLCCGGPGARLVAADEASYRLIRSWMERHKDTPNEAFEVPAFMFPKGVAVGHR